jgi:hypothetical protein
MSTLRSDRIFAALGIGFVVTELVGVGLSSDLHGGGVNDSPAQYAAAIANPIAPHNWVGAYLEMLAVGLFLAFAIWAAGKLGEGVLPQLARAAAGAYAAVTVSSLGLMDGYAYREGHGLTVPVARAIGAVMKATYVGSWFLTAFFLLAIGAQALKVARPRLGWSTIAVAAVTLVAIPSIDNFGELSVLLFFVWVVAAGIALARRAPGAAPTLAAQHA